MCTYDSTRTRRFVLSLLLLSLLSLLPLHLFGTASRAYGQTSAPQAPIVNPHQIYSYERMNADLIALAERYPNLITLGSAGQSEYGRELVTADLGKGPATILLLGSHHAREWITTVTMMKMLEHMAQQYEADEAGSSQARDLLDRVTFRLMPMVNPDGVTLQQFGLAAFPKSDHAALLRMNGGSTNFKRWKANGKGIDLNRQYPANWANIRNPAKGPSYMNYKGTKPLEAKEVQAVSELTLALKPELAVAYHSSGEILYWHFHTKADNVGRDHAFASAYAKLTGYRMMPPSPNPSGGGFTDWFIQDFGRPGLTPELGRAVGETHVPLSEWSRIWKQHQNTSWLMAQTAYSLWMKRQQVAPLHIDIRLTKAENGYQYPDPNTKRTNTVSPGKYKTLRLKGDWLEVQAVGEKSTTSWISSRHVLRGSVELPENMQVGIGPDTSNYDTPLQDKPSKLKLRDQQATVRENWRGWLFVETAEGMRWIRQSDLPVQHEQNEEQSVDAEQQPTEQSGEFGSVQAQ